MDELNRIAVVPERSTVNRKLVLANVRPIGPDPSEAQELVSGPLLLAGDASGRIR